MTTYHITEGLIHDSNNGCAGFIFNFKGCGFDPNGKIQVDGRDITDDEINTHNAILGKAALDSYVKLGQGIFYLSRGEDHLWYVSTWSGGFKARPTSIVESARNAFGHRITCYTVHFIGPDGKEWWGRNQGDNQILRSKRVKS